MTPSIHAAPQEPLMAANACLSDKQLQQLLSQESAPESLAEVSEHLEDCPRCRAALERLTLQSLQLDPEILKDIKQDPEIAEPALAALLDKAKQGQPADDSSHEQLIETEIRSFLKPSDTPGSIGRLDEYEIQGIVGRGGMGIVLKGFDPSLCRTVAIKLLAPHWSVNALARRRFIREARATAAVVHEHIVTIHAVREDAPLPYLVMQFVQGVTLHDKLQKTGPLELKEVLRIGMQAAQGLAVAHAQGLVHRDIKPANILLENGVERVKITDFGLARAVDDASVTHSGVIAGTPEYMSPEQARGEAVDVRSDLFSLGSVLYSLCTGKPPYTGSNALSVVRKVADEPAPHVRRANPEIPNWLAKIISKLMEKRPEDRYPSAAEIARVLEDHLAELQNPSLVEPSAPPERKRPPLQVAAALVLLLSLFGLTYAEATGRTEVLQYVASILRIQTPHGTLVLEIADPEIKVAIDAGGETITGAGPHELTLRPGEHQWQAIRDGKTVDGWVTIDKGEKQVLKVSMEGEKEVERAKVSNDPRPAQATASDPFTQEHDGSLKGERLPETEDDGHDSYSSLIERYRIAAIDAALKKLEDSKTSYLRFDITDISATPPKEPGNVSVLTYPGDIGVFGLSQDGEHALITSSDGLLLWNLAQSNPQPIPGVGSRDGVSGAAFAPNNKMFAVAVSDGLRIYALDDLHSIGRNVRLDSGPGEVAFSGDSQILWVALNKEVIGFDATSGERVGGFYTVEGHGSRLATAGALLLRPVGKRSSSTTTRRAKSFIPSTFPAMQSSCASRMMGSTSTMRSPHRATPRSAIKLRTRHVMMARSFVTISRRKMKKLWLPVCQCFRTSLSLRMVRCWRMPLATTPK